jgi:predicted DNA-binding transcriptional regulator AlpA
MSQRIYRFRELKPAGVPFTRKHIVTLMKRGQFPQQFNLTDFSVAWVADEVDAWVGSKIRARRVVPMASGREAAPLAEASS